MQKYNTGFLVWLKMSSKEMVTINLQNGSIPRSRAFYRNFEPFPNHNLLR